MQYCALEPGSDQSVIVTNLSYLFLMRNDLFAGAGHAMAADEFAFFECKITKRSRVWRWSVSDQSAILIMTGVERTNAEAQYKAARAIFQLLLTAPYRIRTVAE